MNELNLNESSLQSDEHKNIKKKKPFSLKQFLLNLILVILPIFLIITLVLTGVRVSKDGYFFNEINDFRGIWHTSSNNVSEIKEKNANFSGWINSDDGKFDFPIFNKKYQNCSFYIDENCDIESTKNLILHTPQKTNKELSAAVLSFKDINFFNRHPSLEVNTDYYKNSYIAFASYYTDTTDFDIYKFNTLDEKDFNKSIDDLLKSSFLKPNFDVKRDDEFLSIILKDKTRDFVVLARKLREGEKIVFSSNSKKQ